MMEMEKRSGMRAYFVREYPKWIWWLVPLSLFSIIVSDWNPVALGLGATGLGCSAIGLKSWLGRPSDSQVDEWIEEDIQPLFKRAREKAFLDPQELIRDAVMIVGVRMRNGGGALFGMRKGDDREVRFTPLDAVIVNFAKDHLSVYRCALDLTTGNPLQEETSEYFYKHIESVATESRSVTLAKSELSASFLTILERNKHQMPNDQLQMNGGEEFVLSTTGAKEVRVFLRAPALIAAAGGGSIPATHAELAVQAIRKMLREKKAA